MYILCVIGILLLCKLLLDQNENVIFASLIFRNMDKDVFITNWDWMQTLARRVKEYRLAARMSQEEMAEKAGMSKATLAHFEQGVNPNMTLNNFISLLRVVCMENRLDDLLPELPAPPMTLREINKLIPKRVRRKGE